MEARNVKGWVVSPSYVCQIGKVSNTHSLCNKFQYMKPYLTMNITLRYIL